MSNGLFIGLALGLGIGLIIWFDTEIVDAQGDVVACLRKQLYVRRKRDRPAAAPGPQAAPQPGDG